MEQNSYIYFIYGMCFMFYGMMALLFWRKRQERLPRFVMALMILIAMQCLKDIFFMSHYPTDDTRVWSIMTAVDMVAVPLYAFILMELCRPGMVSPKMIIMSILPVTVLPTMYIATDMYVFYIMEVVWVAIYGTGYAVWTVFAIRRYNRLLHQQFSYEENIDLNWLKIILIFFFAILTMWIFDSLHFNIDMERLYLLGSLVMWIFLSYFIYRHESVIGELESAHTEEPQTAGEESLLAARIKVLFDEQRVFLDPDLKLTDIASMTGSNRTYVSRFFNREQKISFFDFVNGYRVRFAIELLRSSDEKMEVIAEKSGFNSRQSFHRVFSKVTGLTPERFRTGNEGN